MQDPHPRQAGLVQLGVFGAAHGIKGEVRLKSFTGDPLAIASYGPLTDGHGRTFELVSVRAQKDMLVARVKDISDRSAAERLVNIALFVSRSVLGEPGEDEFYHADLVGLSAETADGRPAGRVNAVFDFGAGEILEIVAADGGTPLLVPFTRDAVPVIDVAGGRIVIDPPEATGDPEPA